MLNNSVQEISKKTALIIYMQKQLILLSSSEFCRYRGFACLNDRITVITRLIMHCLHSPSNLKNSIPINFAICSEQNDGAVSIKKDITSRKNGGH